MQLEKNSHLKSPAKVVKINQLTKLNYKIMTLSEILAFQNSICLVLNNKNDNYFTFEIDGIPHRFNSKWANCVSDYHAFLWLSDKKYKNDIINELTEEWKENKL